MLNLIHNFTLIVLVIFIIHLNNKLETFKKKNLANLHHLKILMLFQLVI